MKKYLWVLALALVISALSASSLAAESSHAQQDQAFLSSLAQQVLTPVSLVLAAAPPALLAPPANCINLNCAVDSNCWPYCGGPDAVYCDRARHVCIPY
jgi:hypothetical protein